MRLLTLAFATLLAFSVHAEQSSITEADGYSCMGVDNSRKETENLALQDAKRNAVEFSKTYIQSETEMQNFELKKDLVQAFSKANVQVIEVVSEQWDEPGTGDCYNIRIKAEVIPAKEEMQKVVSSGAMLDDPTAPLNVTVWTNKKEYVDGEQVKIYLKANKPFYGRLIYLDASGNQYQILPNRYRNTNYFNGGVMYEYPTGADNFTLSISGPYGKEKILVYASTAELGPLQANDLGPVLEIKEKQVARATRGISISKKTPGEAGGGNAALNIRPTVAEFAEASVEITTRASGA